MGGRLKIGHSSSKDLLTWTPQKEIFLFDDVPEATWDKQRLLLAFADSPQGPWRDVTKPQYYGAYRTRDWKTFEDASKLITFPGETRHGSVVKIPEKLAKKLQAQRR
jgi:hypothetical protein